MQYATLILYSHFLWRLTFLSVSSSPRFSSVVPWGPLLYAKGIFINRSYDELNLSQPELIRGVHHDYLQAGAEIIETNTFGGNSFRLARHSLAEKRSEEP